MIYRTLHLYILRELLRVFLLTASALTTLLAFGGMFRPLTKQGIDISQVMVLMLNLMPAMLAYAIPIAALFAAVLVYWRMSTDNELTACRAGGVSFMSIVLPAVALGIAVASMDMVFVNYVVPKYLRATERAVRRDLGSWIVSQVGRQEKFQYDALPLVVSADSAQQLESDDPNTTIVVLNGMAASFLSGGKVSAMAVAQEARVIIRNVPEQDSAEISFTLKNGAGFDPNNGFHKITGSVTENPYSRTLPSFFRDKAKYMNLLDLRRLDGDPSSFPPVAEGLDRISGAFRFQLISENVQAWWYKTAMAGGGGAERSVTFEQSDPGGEKLQVKLFAQKATINPAASPDECLTFSGLEPGGLKVELWANGRHESTFRSDAADFILALDQFGGTRITGQLRLHGNVTQQKNSLNLLRLEPVGGPYLVSGLEIDPALADVKTPAKLDLLNAARLSPNKGMQDLARNVEANVTKLSQSITSELNSRASFAVSCLTLVMLGAALGILLRGMNPLAVFVVGFVPAIFLVLLITAGRQLTESGPKHTVSGVTMIWAGNAVLLALVGAVYFKLLRR